MLTQRVVELSDLVLFGDVRKLLQEALQVIESPGGDEVEQVEELHQFGCSEEEAQSAVVLHGIAAQHTGEVYMYLNIDGQVFLHLWASQAQPSGTIGLSCFLLSSNKNWETGSVT